MVSKLSFEIDGPRDRLVSFRADQGGNQSEVVLRKSILITPERKAELLTQRKLLKKVFFNVPKKAKPWWQNEPIEPYSPFVQRWRMFMLLPLGYEAWAFPYRLALGVPSMSNNMQLTPADFTFDLFFLADMLVILSTKIPKGPGRDEPATTFLAISRIYFRDTFPFQILPAFPFWLTTFILTNHLQDPAQCGRVLSDGTVTVAWSCALGTLDWQVFLWWISSFIRALPRLVRMVTDFKTLENNLVPTAPDFRTTLTIRAAMSLPIGPSKGPNLSSPGRPAQPR